eukprot:2413643-Pleurochrysis_carterae.AAC.1
MEKWCTDEVTTTLANVLETLPLAARWTIVAGENPASALVCPSKSARLTSPVGKDVVPQDNRAAAAAADGA